VFNPDESRIIFLFGKMRPFILLLFIWLVVGIAFDEALLCYWRDIPPRLPPLMPLTPPRRAEVGCY